MKKLIFFILFGLVGGHIYAQFQLSGTVKDSTGKALIGANVILKQSYYAMSTGSEGEFSFTSIKEGNYLLYISYLGYGSYEKEILIQGDIKLDIVLYPKSILADEVIVTSTKATRDMPVAFTSLQKEDIEMRNLGQDVPYILNMTPSFVISSDAGAGIGYSTFRIRGTDQNRINITLNGIPMNDAESHGTWWVDLPDLVSSVDQIQVQRGVGTSTNGAGAFGATVNFQTFDLRKDAYAEINSSFGSFHTIKNNILLGTGLLNEKFSFDARFSKLYSDGYIDRAYSDLLSFSMSASYYGSKDMIKFIFLSGTEETYQAWDGVPQEVMDTNRTWNGIGMYTDANGEVQFYDNETDNYLQNHLQAFYSRDLGSDLMFNLAFHYTAGRGYYEQYKLDQEFSDYDFSDIIIGVDTITSVDLVRQKWLDNDFYGFTSSMNYKGVNMNLIIGGAWNQYLGDHFGKVIWSEVSHKGDKDKEWYRNNGDKKDWNVFSKMIYRPVKAITLYADMQLRRIRYSMDGLDDDLRDISQYHEHLFFNPKFGLKFRINESNEAFLSFSVANREPNRDNYKDANPLGPLPTSERLFDYEFGYSFQSGAISLDLNVYYMDYKNQLVLTGEINDVGAPIMTNIHDSYRLGLELMAGFIISPGLRWELNTTFSQNKIDDLRVFIDDWDTWGQREEYLGASSLSFSPAIVASSNISIHAFKNFRINVLSKYVGKQYIDNTENKNRMLAAYFLNDLIMKYSFNLKFVKEISFQFMLNNILNVEYESNAWIYRYYSGNVEGNLNGYFPQAGIQFLGGLSLKF